jgi:2-polyprenyl-6-methoxyphenol hydroxylase-like FAD-dependent oxidoreductase
MRVLVVGAGIAGLSVAIALRRVGLHVTVVERAPELREVGAGISLWANALRALDHLGVGESVRERAHSTRRGEFRTSSGRTLLRIDYAGLEKLRGLPPTIWVLHRAELIAALASHVPNDTIALGETLQRIEQSTDGVVASTSSGRRLEADLLVGADGLHSASRRHVFGDEQTPRYANQTCWRGVCQCDAVLHPEDLITESWGVGQRFGVVPLSGRRVYWFAVADAPRGERCDDHRADLLRRFARWASPACELIEATAAEAILRNDVLDRPPRRGWSRGRFVLVGDAAHPTTPNLGQGGCMAIEDAVVLGQSLAGLADGASLDAVAQRLTRFERARYARTARITRDSYVLGWFAQGSSRPVAWLRDTLTALSPPSMVFARVAAPVGYDTGPLQKLL